MRSQHFGLTRYLVLGIILALPVATAADAGKRDWFGDWRMNHDGHAGTLRIRELKADCAAPEWCDMNLSYVDAQGVVRTGAILRIDDRGQHMAFQINFPNNAQKFDAYIFSWQKQYLAGTTRWGGRTFGFFAMK